MSLKSWSFGKKEKKTKTIQLDEQRSIIMINTVASLPSGAIVGCSNDSLLTWSLEEGLYTQYEDFVNGLAVLPNGNVVTGGLGNSLKVWKNIHPFECIQELNGHTSMVSCVVALPNGKVVSGSVDMTLKVWNVDTGKCVQTLSGPNGHTGHIKCMTVLPNGNVVSGSADATLNVWDTDTGKCIQILNGHKELVCSVASLPDGKVLSSSSVQIKIWDAETGTCVQTFDEQCLVSCVTALPNGNIVCGCSDGIIRIRDVNTGKYVEKLKGHSSGIYSMAIFPDETLVSSSLDRTLKIWTLENETKKPKKK